MRRIVAAGLLVAAVLPATARADHVAVVVIDPFPPESYADRGAVGLLVPGAGSEVTRQAALAALVRGKVENTLIGGVPEGKPLVELSERAREITFYVSLPPPGRHHNVRRYPIAVVGGGYRGLLVSEATRIPGLVSIADVAPAVRSLEESRDPVISWEPEPDAPAELRRLERRLSRAHGARLPADVLLAAAMFLAGAAAWLLRSRLLGRTAILVAPSALSAALLLSATGVERPLAVVALLAVLTPLLAGVGALLLSTPGRLAAGLTAFLAAYGLVLALWPEVNALAAIGPHPDGGGRYYGVTNQVGTLLLAPALVAGALGGPAWLGLVAALSLVVVGASATGADGGGAIVLAFGFAALGFNRFGLRPTPRRVALVAAGGAAVLLALVALDAASGGSSHVTRAVEGGPGTLLEDFTRRLELSWRGATDGPAALAQVVFGVAALVWLGLRRPRSPILDALLLALAVSLVVNDTPTDVATYGALSAFGVWSWERARRWQGSRARDRV